MKRFPHCQQLNRMYCGPACLKMVAGYYGRHYSLETLRERSFITREGVSVVLYGILKHFGKEKYPIADQASQKNGL